MIVSFESVSYKLAMIAGCALLAASCGGSGDSSSGGGKTLEGAYLPQFPASANNLDRALTDQRWQFSADGAVTTFSSGGPRNWTYKVKGDKLELKGADANNSGQSRNLAKGDNGCYWDGARGDPSIDTLFCPE